MQLPGLSCQVFSGMTNIVNFVLHKLCQEIICSCLSDCSTLETTLLWCLYSANHRPRVSVLVHCMSLRHVYFTRLCGKRGRLRIETVVACVTAPHRLTLRWTSHHLILTAGACCPHVAQALRNRIVVYAIQHFTDCRWCFHVKREESIEIQKPVFRLLAVILPAGNWKAGVVSETLGFI